MFPQRKSEEKILDWLEGTFPLKIRMESKSFANFVKGIIPEERLDIAQSAKCLFAHCIALRNITQKR